MNDKHADQLTVRVVVSIPEFPPLSNSDATERAMHELIQSTALQFELIRNENTTEQDSTMLWVDRSASHGYVLIHNGFLIAHSHYPMRYNDSDLDNLELREINTPDLYQQFLLMDHKSEQTLLWVTENSGIYLD